MNTSEIRKENLINLYNDKGERHGYWENNYPNGQLWSKGNFVDGNRHGYWEVYWDNGNLFYKGNFVNGKRDGYWEAYYSNGKLDFKGYYVNGKKHGSWEWYYSNGDLEFKVYYDMGKRVDYNPDEPKVVELTLSDIANKLGVDVDKLRIKE
jgi:antitoxin component YwqK of YwqJK toxin-antitoxin module